MNKKERTAEYERLVAAVADVHKQLNDILNQCDNPEIITNALTATTLAQANRVGGTLEQTGHNVDVFCDKLKLTYEDLCKYVREKMNLMTRDRLTEALDPKIHDRKRFEDEVAISNLLSRAVQDMAALRGMDLGTTLGTLCIALTSFVKARVPTEEWADVGDRLAATIMLQLTIKQD